MSFDNSSIEYSDIDYENSSDSGFSVSSYEIPSEPGFPQVGILLPIFSFTIVPVQLVPYFPINETPTQLVHSKHRLVKWSLPPPSAPLVPLPGWKAMPYGLESFWQSAFCWFFRPFLTTHGHLWTMEPTQLPPLSVEWPWHSTTFLAKVRFQCECKRGWTSMKGRIVFWFRIRRQGEQILCEVLFKLFGQKCGVCNPSASVNESEFLTPLWYPDEIENAIKFLSNQVITSYYGGRKTEVQPPSIRFHNKETSSDRPLVHHDSTRCQACQYGFCVISKSSPIDCMTNCSI